MRIIIFLALLFCIPGCIANEDGQEAKTPVEEPHDILEYVAKHPRGVSIVTLPDGSQYVAKYGDFDLEQAEKVLTGKYPRPWTVTKAIRWYRDAKDAKVRGALLRLLAASRDSRAVPILGAALDDPSLKVRASAMYALLDYFIGTVEGSSEQHAEAARLWWKKHKAEYADEAE